MPPASAQSSGFAVDANGDLSVTPLAGRSVLVQGVDVPTEVTLLHGRLRALETALRIPALEPIPSGPSVAGTVPRVGQDSLGNLLLIPAPNRSLVLAGVRVLDLLSQLDRRLARVETRVLGSGAAPNVTSTPRAAPVTRPGTVGLDSAGSLRIEPLAGRTVLAAGRDMVLELHRLTARLNFTEMAVTACPCLLTPATCRPCNGNGGCNVSLASASSFSCACNAGLTGNGTVCVNIDECVSGTHNCSPFASCTDLHGAALFACACNTGFVGSGVLCRPVNVTGRLDWARQTGSARDDHDGCVAVDNAGRVFLAGSVGQTADGFAFGGVVDVLLTAFNGSTGTKLWSQMIGSTGADHGLGVAADGAGNVYATGYTTGDLDGQSNAGSRDVFLVRLNSTSGASIWTQLLGTGGNDESLCVAVDPGSPDVIDIGGYTESTAESALPGSNGKIGGAYDAFVARYNRTGGRMWVRQFGSSDDDVCIGVAVYQSDLYATGQTTGVMGSGANAGQLDVFVARISLLGAVVWTVQLGSAGIDRGMGISVDSSGVYVTGYAGGNLGGKTYAGGPSDVFVARYTHAGASVWIQMLRSSLADFGLQVALDRGGNVLVAGGTGGALSDQTGIGGSDVLVASFSGTGELRWVRLLGTVADDSGSSIAVDGRTGAAFVAGTTRGAIDILPSSGGRDLFVMKLL